MDLQTLEQEALKDLEAVSTLRDLESVSIKYLGRKEGQLTAVLRNLGSLPPEEKKRIGQAANSLRVLLEEKISFKKDSLQQASFHNEIKSSQIDVTLPGYPFPRGHSHPIAQTIREINRIFRGMGFEVVEEREIESDFHNFSALNIPQDHPARDLHDTFYIQPGPNNKEESEKPPVLLRTHTSSVQIRLMEAMKAQKMEPPIRIIAPGRVYRHEATDATHAAIFHQVEGLAIDKNISFAELKGTLTQFSKKFFGSDLRVRFRPSYFPFVEPGAEMDLQCFSCGGTKKNAQGERCSLCKGTGWIEMLGAGLVHPQVLRNVGYNPEKYTGFAFGMGVERIVMVRSRVKDIRWFLESDQRFLEMFP